MKLTYLLISFFIITPSMLAQSNTWENYQHVLDEGAVILTFKGLLGKFKHNAFDYAKVHKSDKAKKHIHQQKDILKKYTPPQNRYEKLSFWINAYNFYTLVDVIDEFPIKSMKDIGWKKRHHLIDGKKYSLDDIEHKIIRPMGDPRIHFAINCASVSCPGLKAKVYTAKSIRQELSQQSSEAFKNPLHLSLKNNELYATKLFDWFEEDFEGYFKSPEHFIKKYADKSLHLDIEEWIEYNWLLNNPQNIKMALSKLNVNLEK